MTLFSSKGCAVSIATPVLSTPSLNVKYKTLVQLSSAVLLGTLVSACGSSDSSSSTPDTTAPEITLSGADSVDLGQGRDYLEYGLTVIDDIDGDISEFDTVFTADIANTCTDISDNESDDYNCVDDIFYVTYTASDSAGNVSEALERTVTIVEARPFIFTYQTLVADEAFTLEAIATDDYDFNFDVDWGDGEVVEGLTETTSHTYADAGTYTISISGEFPRFSTQDSGELEQYLSIEQWGDIQWQNVYRFLYGAINVQGNATDTPDLRLVTSLYYFFEDAANFNGDISLWQVGHITSMEHTFDDASSFNQDISGWDVSSVETFAHMFDRASAFNQDISSWDVSSATSIRNMFDSTSFNQDISGWDVSQVETFRSVFQNSPFDHDISGWEMSKATTIVLIFDNSKLSTAHYDALLISLASQEMADGLYFHVGCSEPSSASDVAVDTLVNDKSWIIEYNTEEECAELFGEE